MVGMRLQHIVIVVLRASTFKVVLGLPIVQTYDRRISLWHLKAAADIRLPLDMPLIRSVQQVGRWA